MKDSFIVSHFRFIIICISMHLICSPAASSVSADTKMLAGTVSDLRCQIDPAYFSNKKNNAQQTTLSAYCDYRHEINFKPTKLELKIGSNEIEPNNKKTQFNVEKYPAANQKTAILILLDVSDPRRVDTVVKLYPEIVQQILNDEQSHTLIGIYTFADQLAPIKLFNDSSARLKLKPPTLVAYGQATEMYRLIIDAVEVVSKQPADRRLIIVVSDGKAEDTSFSLEDATKVANKKQVSMLTIGVSEKPSDVKYLQSLRRMASDTDGIFLDFSNKVIPKNILKQALTLTDVGGRVNFDVAHFYGDQKITLILKDDKNNKSKTLTQDLKFPDDRTLIKKSIDFIVSHWLLSLLSLLFFILLTFLVVLRYRKAREKRKRQNRVIAVLRTLDGMETQHKICKSAVTVGRNETNDIILKNSSVSARHAELHQTRTGTFRLVDLGSTNGCFVNGKSIIKAELSDGDIIEFGEVRMQLRVKH